MITDVHETQELTFVSFFSVFTLLVMVSNNVNVMKQYWFMVSIVH